MEGRGGGVWGEGNVPSIENIFAIISRKIGETYTWLKNKLISLFKLFSESIKEALLGLNSFVTSCCEKLREMLSWINTQLDSSHQHGNRMVVVPEEALLVEMQMGVPEKPSLSLLEELKTLLQKLRNPVNQLFGFGISLQMKAVHQKLIGFLNLSEGFIELLGYACEKRFLLLIPPIIDGFFIFLSSKKNPGRGMKSAVPKGKAAMAIGTLISLIRSLNFLSQIKV